MTTLKHDDYKIGWICALSVELAAAKAMLDQEHESLPKESLDSNTYAFGRIGKHNIAIACLPDGEYGTNTAACIANNMKRTFESMEFGLMVGIAGGIPSDAHDIRLGDIVVSSPEGQHGGVVQYDLGQMTPKGFLRKGFLSPPPIALRTAVTQLRGDHLLGRNEVPTYLFPRNLRLPSAFGRPSLNDELFMSNYVHIENKKTCADCDRTKLVPRDPRANAGDPVIHYGTIASGNMVMKDAEVRDRYFKQNNVLCFEMEAAGLMNSFPCIVIRGISDYADSHKNNTWENYAAATAAAYAKELLRCINPFKQTDVIMPNTHFPDIKRPNHFSHLSKWLGSRDCSGDIYELLGRHHDGTCEWIIKDDRFIRWMDKNHENLSSQVLHIFGYGGVGKSIVSAYISDRVIDKTGELCAFFFFNRSFSNQISAVQLLKSTAYQLSERSQTFRSYLEQCEKNLHPDDMRIPDLWEYLIYRGLKEANVERFFWVIDALDECDNSKEDLLRILKPLLQRSPFSIRILITSRNESELSFLPQSLICSFRLMSGQISMDIQRFAKDKLAALDILHDNPTLQSTILLRLVPEGSPSNFLWVSTIISRMENVTSIDGVFECFIGLPDKLESIYAGIVTELEQRLDPDNLAKIFHILSWINTSFQPLSISQLSDAVSFSFNQNLDVCEVKLLIRKNCNNLFFLSDVDRPDDPYVKPYHSSLKDFLDTLDLSRYFTSVDTEIWARSKMATLYLQYIPLKGKIGMLCDQQWEARSPKQVENAPPLLEYTSCGLPELIPDLLGHHDTETILQRFFSLDGWLAWISSLAVFNRLDRLLRTADRLTDAAKTCQLSKLHAIHLKTTADQLRTIFYAFRLNLESFPGAAWFSIPAMFPENEQSLIKTLQSYPRHLWTCDLALVSEFHLWAPGFDFFHDDIKLSSDGASYITRRHSNESDGWFKGMLETNDEISIPSKDHIQSVDFRSDGKIVVITRREIEIQGMYHEQLEIALWEPHRSYEKREILVATISCARNRYIVTYDHKYVLYWAEGYATIFNVDDWSFFRKNVQILDADATEMLYSSQNEIGSSKLVCFCSATADRIVICSWNKLNPFLAEYRTVTASEAFFNEVVNAQGRDYVYWIWFHPTISHLAVFLRRPYIQNAFENQSLWMGGKLSFVNLRMCEVQETPILPNLSNFGQWIWSERESKCAYALNSSCVYQFQVCLDGTGPKLIAICQYRNYSYDSPDSDARLIYRDDQKFLITVLMGISEHRLDFESASQEIPVRQRRLQCFGAYVPHSNPSQSMYALPIISMSADGWNLFRVCSVPSSSRVDIFKCDIRTPQPLKRFVVEKCVFNTWRMISSSCDGNTMAIVSTQREKIIVLDCIHNRIIPFNDSISEKCASETSEKADHCDGKIIAIAVTNDPQCTCIRAFALIAPQNSHEGHRRVFVWQQDDEDLAEAFYEINLSPVQQPPTWQCPASELSAVHNHLFIGYDFIYPDEPECDIESLQVVKVFKVPKTSPTSSLEPEKIINAPRATPESVLDNSPYSLSIDFYGASDGVIAGQLHVLYESDKEGLIICSNPGHSAKIYVSPRLNTSLYSDFYTSRRFPRFHHWKDSRTLFFIDNDGWLSSCQLEIKDRRTRQSPKRHLLLRELSVFVDMVLCSPDGDVQLFSRCKFGECESKCLTRQMQEVLYPIMAFNVPEIARIARKVDCATIHSAAMPTYAIGSDLGVTLLE